MPVPHRSISPPSPSPSPPLPSPSRIAVAVSLAVSSTVWAQTEPATSATTPAAVEQIEVKAVRLREKPGVSTLTRDELLRMPGAAGDPMKAAQALPGVITVDDASSEPAVRGARPADNLYYVDFLPVGYLFHMGGFSSVFNGDLIRRFDMYGAAWSPEYGDALGAVFDLSLRRPRADRIGGKLDFSLLGGTTLIEGPLSENTSFFLSARRSWFDLAAKTGEDKQEGIRYTVPVYHDVQGRLLWQSSPESLFRLDFSGAADRLTFNIQPGGRLAQQEPILTGDGAERRSYNSIGAVWDVDSKRVGAHTIAVGSMKTRDAFRAGGAGSVKDDSTLNYFRYQTQLRPLKNHELLLGTSLQRRQVDINFDFNDPRCTEFDPNCDISSSARVTTKQSVTQNMAEVYLSDRWTVQPGLVGVLGARVVRDGYIKKTYAEPRIGLEWQASKSTMLNIAVGKHNQPADSQQTIRDLGNPGLLRLRSTHAAMGVSHQFASGWSLRSEVYKKKFEDLVITDPVKVYRNGARGSSEGLELLIKSDPKARLSGFASLTLSRARRENEASGKRFPFDYDQPVVFNLVGLWKQSDRWQYGAKWSYHSGSPYTPIVSTGRFADGRVRPIYGDINSQRVPAYHRLDLRADYKVSKNFTGYFELINAYNRKNVAGYDYSADYKTNTPVYQLPALPSFGVTYSF
jgi:hypothetical protein